MKYDGGRRGYWAEAAERPGFSIVEVLSVHTLCSRRKILAVRHISIALRRGGHLLGSTDLKEGTCLCSYDYTNTNNYPSFQKRTHAHFTSEKYTC